MKIFPAIDIKDKKCVRLVKGDFENKTEYEMSPVEQASKYKDCGFKNLHIVDLDGALTGEIVNLDIIQEIVKKFDLKIEIGGGRVVQQGTQVCVLNLGTRLEECKLAVEELKAKGVSTTLIDARFAKPLDEKLILKSAKEHELMITVEEGSIGGFGSHVKNLLAERGVFDKGLKFRSMTLPDEFIEQDDPKKMYDKAGLNSSQISKKIADILFQKETIRVVKN